MICARRPPPQLQLAAAGGRAHLRGAVSPRPRAASGLLVNVVQVAGRSSTERARSLISAARHETGRTLSSRSARPIRHSPCAISINRARELAKDNQSSAVAANGDADERRERELGGRARARELGCGKASRAQPSPAEPSRDERGVRAAAPKSTYGLASFQACTRAARMAHERPLSCASRARPSRATIGRVARLERSRAQVVSWGWSALSLEIDCTHKHFANTSALITRSLANRELRNSCALARPLARKHSQLELAQRHRARALFCCRFRLSVDCVCANARA